MSAFLPLLRRVRVLRRAARGEWGAAPAQIGAAFPPGKLARRTFCRDGGPTGVKRGGGGELVGWASGNSATGRGDVVPVIEGTPGREGRRPAAKKWWSESRLSFHPRIFFVWNDVSHLKS